MKRTIFFLTVAALFFTGAFSASAGSLLAVPNTFTQGSPAYAASVNANFDAVELEVTDNANNIAANAASIIQNRLDISGNSLAITSHTHTTGEITSGTFGNSYFSAYSDLGTEGYLNNDAGTDLLTRSQADGLYPSSSHAHTTGDLTDWPLDTGLFSAYNDLNAENRIGTADSTNLLTRGQSDGRYVNAGLKTGFHSISPADCVAQSGSYDFNRTPLILENLDSLSDNYLCSVHLPQGAVIQSMTVEWTDFDPGINTVFNLIKYNNAIPVASVTTSGNSGPGSGIDNSILNAATVDNTSGPYTLVVTLPNTNFAYHYATIEYIETLN